MGWRCCWRVTCDQCCKEGPLGASDTAEPKAVKAGWLAWQGIYGRFHACPECRGKLNEDLSASLADSNEVRGD